MLKKLLIVTMCLAVTALVFGQEVEWKSLFDGEHLDGWEVRGGYAKYRVEDGCIVGQTAKGSPNTFLCTVRDYGDFILEFDVMCDPKLNSGVQIRSHVYCRDTTTVMYRNGQKRERVRPAGHVYGYQVEISSAESGASGGVWDEARKAMWLHGEMVDPKAGEALKNNEWNRYRIECIGCRIRTFINGVAITDFVDTTDLSGFIGLQVHSVGKGVNAEVRWKNIRIKDLGRHVWKPIFDGISLDGWHTLPGGSWTVEKGILVGSSPVTERKHGLLVTNETYSDFVARVKYKAVKGNSGLYFRVDEVSGAVGVHGLQAEIDAANDAGGLYETGGRAWVVKPAAESVAKWFRPGEWNEMTVFAEGRNVVVHVNGYKTAELNNDKGRTRGKLALQLHGNQDMEVQFKDVSILTRGKVSRPFYSIGPDFEWMHLDGWITKGRSGRKNLWIVGIPFVCKDRPKELQVAPPCIPGMAAMVNHTIHHGESQDIYTKQTFGSCHLELEVMVPLRSNSGIYMMGEYEIQVLDSFGKPDDELGGGDMGAIYGVTVPAVNASTAPGTWQRYVIDWQAPVFDESGKKVKNARFIKVELNGRTLHESLVMPDKTPGGVDGKEKPKGPLMFQGNHGPVAYRRIVVTEW